MFKATFLLLALWMGGDGYDYYIFDKPKFQSNKQCVLYIMTHLTEKNDHVSKQFGDNSSTNNKFWCVNAKDLKGRLEKTRHIQL